MNEPFGFYQFTILHALMRYDLLSMAPLLIQYGADVNSQDRLGGTVLHYALGYQRFDFVMNYLIRMDLKWNIADRQNVTPLDLAISSVDARIQSLANAVRASANKSTIVRSKKRAKKSVCPMGNV